jgi:hypothetical protein
MKFVITQAMPVSLEVAFKKEANKYILYCPPLKLDTLIR